MMMWMVVLLGLSGANAFGDGGKCLFQCYPMDGSSLCWYLLRWVVFAPQKERICHLVGGSSVPLLALLCGW
jgi:hypothetical protein